MDRNFRLKQVLKVREIKEKAGQQRLAEAAETVEEHRQLLATANQNLRRTQNDMKRKIGSEPTAGELSGYAQSVEGGRQRRSGEEKRLHAAEQNLSHRQSQQVTLWQDRETMTRLQRDFQSRQRAAVTKKNQHLLDEIAASDKARR